MTVAPPIILIAESDGFSPEAARLLAEVGQLRFLQGGRGELLSAVREAQVLWVRLAHYIDEEVLAAATCLKCVVTPTTGLNHIDLAAATARGIQVLSLKGEVDFLKEVRATAELTIALMLALLRHLPAAQQHVLSGGWNRDPFRGRELSGRKVGVVGCGRLGRIVAALLLAFGSRVVVADPHVRADEVPPGAQWLPLDDLLRQVEMVTLHVNLDDRTRGFFSRPQFAQMQPGATLINTARGELIEEAALLDALESKRLAGAALDVVCDEHLMLQRPNPLIEYARRHPNVLITPHLGGCTFESMEKTEIFMAEKLRRFMAPPRG